MPAAVPRSSFKLWASLSPSLLGAPANNHTYRHGLRVPHRVSRTLTYQWQRQQSTAAAPELGKSHTLPASELNHDVTREEKSEYDKKVAKDKSKQMRAPWHRQGSEKPPVAQLRSAGAMTKGKLLTTPTRLFKLVLPLTTRDFNEDRKDVEPLALLVHPQQPLSYLERLIQSELPTLDVSGVQKIPAVNFLAEDSSSADRQLGDANAEKRRADDLDKLEGKEDEGHTHLREHSPDAARELRGGPGEGGVESYSGLGQESDPDNARPTDFVRWSKSTEIGDFMRDAARGREFAVEIQGAPYAIYVGVPSFGDRTYYLRLRLRKKAKLISSMAEIKRECDRLAHRSAQRVAYAGFGGMLGWAGIVTYCTFETSLGWDVMEPVTYLVGLLGLLGGYAWFLFNRREASYASAMSLTVSRRQSQLYSEKGFDLQRYNDLIEEGNALRREIRLIANEYDVEWDERRDAQDDKVIEALRKHRQKKRKGANEEDKEEDNDDDDEGDKKD